MLAPQLRKEFSLGYIQQHSQSREQSQRGPQVTGFHPLTHIAKPHHAASPQHLLQGEQRIMGIVEGHVSEERITAVYSLNLLPASSFCSLSEGEFLVRMQGAEPP